MAYTHNVTLPAPKIGIGTGAGSTRQLNFLQKLYEFMALEPHPCPDVIYWAADSRQLVIAQPERLVKEVLPLLFKHDKLSSFGRQLNIYGFARVFPGRQFKDANGHVLDASVWAHPTLHRLSTPQEVSSIRRRAAPKLFRTRRLANGQIVRSRAGPEVERKFREIKQDMAGERRNRNHWPASTSGRTSSRHSTRVLRPRSPSIAPREIHHVGNGDPDRRWSSHGLKIDTMLSPSTPGPLHWSAYYPRKYSDGSISSTIDDRAQPLMTAPAQYNRFEYPHLSCITEGVAQHETSHFNPYFQGFHQQSTDTSPSDSLPQSPSLDIAPPATFHSLPSTQVPIGATINTPTVTATATINAAVSATASAKATQSCPASIRTSPILSATTFLPHWTSNGMMDPPPAPHPSQDYHRSSTQSATSRESTYRINDEHPGHDGSDSNMLSAHPPDLRITAPAAPPDLFELVNQSGNGYDQFNIPQIHPLSKSHSLDDSMGSWNYNQTSTTPTASGIRRATIHPLSINTTNFTGMDFSSATSMAYSATPMVSPGEIGMGMGRRDTIDPRWVSPLASNWSTPVHTPLPDQLGDSTSTTNRFWSTPSPIPHDLPGGTSLHDSQRPTWNTTDPFRRSSDPIGPIMEGAR